VLPDNLPNDMQVTFRRIYSDLGFELAKQIATWDKPFYNPIELPNGKLLVTLRDAALYITKLTKAEHKVKEWQAATGALILVDVCTARRFSRARA
jgi:hypothetical protein